MAILDAKRLVIDDPEAEVPEHFRTYAANRDLQEGIKHTPVKAFIAAQNAAHPQR
jgi:hypothetical protein